MAAVFWPDPYTKISEISDNRLRDPYTGIIFADYNYPVGLTLQFQAGRLIKTLDLSIITKQPNWIAKGKTIINCINDVYFKNYPHQNEPTTHSVCYGAYQIGEIFLHDDPERLKEILFPVLRKPFSELLSRLH
jgi:hypothetical protein